MDLFKIITSQCLRLKCEIKKSILSMKTKPHSEQMFIYFNMLDVSSPQRVYFIDDFHLQRSLHLPGVECILYTE